MRKTIHFISEFDGSAQQAILVMPDEVTGDLLPLIIVPHAAGFSAEATAAYWGNIPVKRNVIAVFPVGHSRKMPLFSLGWAGQLADLAALPFFLQKTGYPVDTKRVYGVGISMGGLECLLLAGRHPELLSGVAAFNPVVDLQTWYYDVEDETVKPTMTEEIGGGPEKQREEYIRRSPINFTATISKVPVLLYWDPEDGMVQYQSEKQSGLLYRKIIEANPDAQVEQRIHHHGHFWIRPALALDWFFG